MTDEATLQHCCCRQGFWPDSMDVQARTEVSQSWQVPYKEYNGWHTRCLERVQSSKCFMAGEHGAQMTALDMTGEVSSVAARHCSLPLQCKCASSGETTRNRLVNCSTLQ